MSQGAAATQPVASTEAPASTHDVASTERVEPRLATSDQAAAIDTAEDEGTADEECGDARVVFAEGSAVLDSRAREQLTEYAACVSRHDTNALFIRGVSDPTGGSAHNAALAQARGRAVASFLAEAGLRMDFEIRAHSGGHGGGPLDRSATVSDHPPQITTPGTLSHSLTRTGRAVFAMPGGTTDH